MHDTRITLTSGMRERLAVGHGPDLQPVSNWDLTVLAGAGGWRSSVSDMLRFLGAAGTPPQSLLGDALRMSLAQRRPTGQAGLGIGLGWHLLDTKRGAVAWHNGGTGGYRSFIGLVPATGANVVVLSNTAADVDDIGLHWFDPGTPVTHPPPPRAAIEVETAILQRYAGRYELSPEFAVDVTHEDKALFVQATGQPRFPVFAASPTRFFLRVVDAEVEFTLDASGAATGLVLHQDGRATPGRRVTPR